MLAPIEHVPDHCRQYAERIKDGESLRSVATEFKNDYGSEDPAFFRIGYFASLLGGPVELDFDWLDIALDLAKPT